MGLLTSRTDSSTSLFWNFAAFWKIVTRSWTAEALTLAKDYEVINELGLAYFERAKMERMDVSRQKKFLLKSIEQFKRTLEFNCENVMANYNFSFIVTSIGR